ncbi:MAG: helix-turn-helix domain-containing protein [Cryomorphaceae bacterium]
MRVKSIAVLPFVNMSSDAENEYFSDGITEEIINALAQIDALKVTSRTSSFFFKGKNIPITQIGKELDVATLLEGSVRLSGNAMRITAQLIDASNDFHFWSETWDRQLDNIFEVQDEISLLIADKLREHFGHFEIQEHLVERKTESVDAYTLFLKGLHHLNKWNPEDVKQSMALFEKALSIDPNHAESMVGLADAYSFLAMISVISFEEGWGKCAELTHKALSINNALPSAYYQLANLALFTACDYAEAIALTKKAIALNANHILSRQFMAFLYIVSGRKVEARKQLDLAMSIDPLSQETLFYSGYIDYMCEDYSASLKQLDACLEVNPMNIPVLSVKVLCFLMTNRCDEALGFFDNLPAEVIVKDDEIGVKTIAHTLKGNKAEAAEYLEKLEERASAEDGFAADAFLFLFLGATRQNDKAFEWVAKAHKSRSPILLLRYSEPLVNPIKSDVRYAEYREKLYPEHLFQLEQNTKVKKPLLDEAAAAEGKDRITTHIETHKPYLDPEVSLRSLSNELEIQPNQLSWLLNDGFGKNFNEFINHYRVEEFKALAKLPESAHLTIMSMAYDCGFNSKTVFNTYFKKETGLTPKQFLKE